MELGSTEGLNKAGKAQLASTMAQGLCRLDVLFNGFGRCQTAQLSICPLNMSLASHHVFSLCSHCVHIFSLCHHVFSLWLCLSPYFLTMSLASSHHVLSLLF